MAQTVKRLPTMWETWVRSLRQEDPLEKEMATHSSTLAWKIPWMEEPGRPQSVRSQRVGDNWATSPSWEVQGFSSSSVGKDSACNAGDSGSVPALGRSPGEGHGNQLRYSWLENPHGQRSLPGYSPWGGRESDTTERLGTAQHERS